MEKPVIGDSEVGVLREGVTGKFWELLRNQIQFEIEQLETRRDIEWDSLPAAEFSRLMTRIEIGKTMLKLPSKMIEDNSKHAENDGDEDDHDPYDKTPAQPNAKA